MRSIVVEEIAPFVIAAEGCGRRATYHCELLGDEARCLLESRDEGADEPPATTPQDSPEIQLL